MGIPEIWAVFLNILIFSIPGSKCASSCGSSQNIVANADYYIKNNEYPSRYAPYTNCLWVRTAPSGSVIDIYCEVVEIPSSAGCSQDQLKISLSGDATLSDAKIYCGSGTLSLTTTSNRVAIGLAATGTSSGGRLLCNLRAKQITPACDCGLKKATRIVGGDPTGINEYPMAVGLIDAPSAEILCGGTIIHERYVLTAAHCMRRIPQSTLGILAGDWDPSTGSDTPAAALYRAEAVYIHPNFDEQTGINDIAVIRTAKPIKFSMEVGPACLPFRYTNVDMTNRNLTILGWGAAFTNGPNTDVENKVVVPVISNAQCQQSYTQTITNGNICTFLKGKDACQQDSGGPCLYEDRTTARVQVIGVISYGYACGVRPGIHTRVTAYLDWILSVTPDAYYCVR